MFTNNVQQPVWLTRNGLGAPDKPCHAWHALTMESKAYGCVSKLLCPVQKPWNWWPNFYIFRGKGNTERNILRSLSKLFAPWNFWLKWNKSRKCHSERINEKMRNLKLLLEENRLYVAASIPNRLDIGLLSGEHHVASQRLSVRKSWSIDAHRYEKHSNAMKRQVLDSWSLTNGKGNQYSLFYLPIFLSKCHAAGHNRVHSIIHFNLLIIFVNYCKN